MAEERVSLYRLTSLIGEVDDLIEADEEITEEIATEIKANILEDIQNKGANIAKYLRHLETELEGTVVERKRLQELEKRRKKKVERTKEYILDCLVQAKLKSLETPVGKLSYRTSKKVEILDESLIEDVYKTKKVEVKVSKTEIKKALQNGEVVAGAVLEESKSLSLK